MKTKIAALTGIRSEYDLMYPLLEELSLDPSIDLGVIVSGAHLTPLHEYSYKQIEKDGFVILDRIESLLNSDSLLGKAKSSAILMEGIAQVLNRVRPDYLIVLGDREESIIGALTAGYMNIPVIHLAGGDHTNPAGGNIDEQVRHATSKLSHIHLTMKEEHSERLIRMGEEPWRVFTVGSGGIDRIRKTPLINTLRLSDKLSENVLSDYAVIIYHSINSNIKVSREEISACFEAMLSMGLKVFVGYPNSDPGSRSIIEVIEAYRSHPDVTIYQNLDRINFINLLRNAKLLVGNSSLGLHEAPYLKLPTINVGQRQRGRLAGPNVTFVDANVDEIVKAADKFMKNENLEDILNKNQDYYGDGYMARRSLEIIKKLPSKEKLLDKRMTY